MAGHFLIAEFDGALLSVAICKIAYPVVVVGRVHPAYPDVRLSDCAWNRLLQEWESVATPARRRELLMDESLFHLGSSSSGTRIVEKKGFLPTSLDSLDLSFGDAVPSIATQPSEPPEPTEPRAKKKKSNSRKPLVSASSSTVAHPSSSARMKTKEKNAVRSKRLLSKYQNVKYVALSFT